MRLVEQARSIFAELGYTVEGTGPEFRAERAWKVVHVNPVSDTQQLPTGSGEFRCFVAESGDADDLGDRLRSRDPDYEWAIIVVDGEEYQVERAPPGPRVSA
ncbi:DUF7116 family protein [Natrialbaceae archaeon AArc-T1-2]|uniref:DUF7116 family protein n=1 Tax=Natrialbaceae archaeon AArc-T1-2 TaxID=3053904 RepID=UPI00255AE89B|nr:hypothetical protein [Natrialbaceae archaeon AArc-T1-2]WIV68672.1 hypothetical protein QQ977_13690 [Natrialbaceae archaeon AArc-T1-2]